MTDKLVLGTVQFGCSYGINSAGRPDEAMVQDILREALASGVNTLDTSCAYGDAEKVLGRTMPRAAGDNAPFRIVSKYLHPDAGVEEVFEASLRRLGCRKLWGYMVHHFEDYLRRPQIWDSFRRLRDEGRTEHIGFSLYSPDELQTLLDRGVDFDLVQIPRNLFDRRFDPLLPALKEKGVTVHVRSTFLQGLFFKDRDSLGPVLEPLRPYLLELDAHAGESGLSVAQLALGYNLQNPLIAGVLTGVDNVSQLKDNIASITDKKIDIDLRVTETALLNPVNWK